MELTFAQLAGLLAGAFFCYHAYLQFRKRVFNAAEFALWLLIWGALAILSIISATLFPLTTTTVFSYRLIDLVVVSSVIGLFAVTYLIFREVKVYQTKTRELVKQMAFFEADSRRSKR